jgi:hypothetical protein
VRQARRNGGECKREVVERAGERGGGNRVTALRVIRVGPISRPKAVDLFMLMPPSVGDKLGHYDVLCLLILWSRGS